MDNAVKTHDKRGRLFPYLLILSGIFLLVQVIVYLTVSTDVNYIFMLLAKKTIQVPWNVMWGQVFFVGIQLALYVGFALLIWMAARLIGAGLKLSWSRTCRLGFLFWGLAVLDVFIANQYFFPGSSVALVLAVVLPHWLTVGLYWFLTPLVCAVALFALISAFVVLWRHSKAWCFLGSLMAALVVFFGHAFMQTAIAKPMPNAKPNVIIIGIDSLRPDYTDFGGYQGASKISPVLDHLLGQSVSFDNALTPLARTFPSWTAILTGEYPIHNGVRFNLASQQFLHLKDALGSVLQREGYYTYYATDDRRFSNISRKYGFNKTLGPREGANDFVLGTINDFPLSNLIVNSRLGDHLFPYTAGNRAAYATYYPQTFSNMVERHLQRQQHRPIFLAIHFCMPHWPYAWAKGLYRKKDFPVGLYENAIRRQDVQLRRFVSFLKKHHFLDHAVLVVLSDHGEGLLLPHDRLISKAHYIKGAHSQPDVFKGLETSFVKDGSHFDTSYGHGTDVLSRVQAHTLLAFKTYGMRKNTIAKRIATPVSSVDIKPTVLGFLHYASPQTDGISLVPYMYAKKTHPKDKPLFVESGFTPNAFKGGKISLKQLIANGATVFQINPSDTLRLKPSMAGLILPGKQRAVFYKQWVLALYPQEDQKVIAVLVNRTTQQWTDDLHSRFAKKAPVAYLLNALNQLYGKEVNTRPPYVHIKRRTT